MQKEESEKIFGKDFHEINDKKIVARMIMSETFLEQWDFFKKKCSKNESYKSDDLYDFSFVMHNIFINVKYSEEEKCLNVFFCINGIFNINDLRNNQDFLKETKIT